ncbi:zinc finger protein ZFPM1-like [Ischnura elegans]|uniref:zinc finger protein ZFPM1-like n=1 Tax=Ischnura elegans TaxID=197161 RepID=UPI001ED8BE8D|nr:zinc finger protein ZFPM1-like [Ischnura elegans]
MSTLEALGGSGGLFVSGSCIHQEMDKASQGRVERMGSSSPEPVPTTAEALAMINRQAYAVGGGACGGTPLSFLNLPPASLQAIAAAASAAKPGVVTTVRVPVASEADLADDPDSTDPTTDDPRPPIREVDGPEAGFVCAKCRLAFPSDAALLAHQRLSCFAAAPSDARGGIRLVRALYECRICRERFHAPKLARKHCTSKHPPERHHFAETNRPSPGTPVSSPPAKPPSRGSSLLPPPPPGPSTSLPPPPPPPESPSVGLSYEMEDVVNQIAALAKAAAESTVDSNANISGSSKEGGEGRSDVGELRTSPPSRPPSTQLAVPL